MATKIDITFNEEQFVKYRSVAKRKLSLTEKAIQKFHADGPNGNLTLIKKHLEDLPNIFDYYERYQVQLEVNSEQPDSHYHDREVFTETYYSTLAKLTDIVHVESRPPSCVGSPDCSRHSSLMQNATLQLSQISVPSFSGKLTEWLNFRDMFVSLVTNNVSISDTHKLYYLRNALTGEPFELISSLPLTQENFSIAWNLVYERYNNSKVILTHHLKNLLHLPQVKNSSADEYRMLVNAVVSNQRAIESLLPETVNFHEALITEMLLEKLPKADQHSWNLQNSTRDINLKSLINHIECKAQSLEIDYYINNNACKPINTKNSTQNKGSSKTFANTAATCTYCDLTNHKLEDCRKFIAIQIEQKREFLKKKHLCFRCFKGHSFHKCKVTCFICNGSHHKLLHVNYKNDATDSAATAKNEIPAKNVENFVGLRTRSNCELRTLLPTATVQVLDCHGNIVTARAILDSCSHHSFISTKLLNKLKLPTKKSNLTVSGINGAKTANAIHTCDLKLRCQTDNSLLNVNCAALNCITSNLPPTYIDASDWGIPANINLSDNKFNQPGKVDLLLGSDVFFAVIMDRPLRKSGHPTILNTKFGHVIAGELPDKSCQPIPAATCALTRTELLETQVRRFWESEEIHHVVHTKEERFCEQQSQENTTRDPDGRFIVKLPIRLEVQIDDTRNNAAKRMSLLERRSFYEDKQVHTALITSKSRVSPLKKQTLPRLELCGAVLLTRLLKKVLDALKFKYLNAVHLWCDYTIILSWIYSCVNKLKTFVANRIAEIRDGTETSWWHHVCSADNSADVISRGVFPHQLPSLEIWWKGPSFLKESTIDFPSFQPNLSCNAESQYINECKSETMCMHATVNNDISEFIGRYSNLNTLKKVFTYVLRFINCVKFPKEKKLESVTSDEINTAFLHLVSLVQRQEYADEFLSLKKSGEVSTASNLKTLFPFIDENNVLRVGGRLNNADLPYETKHQMILPAKNHLTELIIRNCHIKLLHSGFQPTLSSLRERFWIPAGRATIKKILRSCVTCFHTKSTTSSHLMGQLPTNRVKQAYPFEYVGVDYAGPVTLKLGTPRSKVTGKAYIALFTCLSTRAVHLELVSNLTSEAFIACLKRFTARRGKCRQIISDNGTNFVGACKLLKNFLRDKKSQEIIRNFGLQEELDWKFLPPRSPHFGGCHESEIKCMKNHLKKTIGLTTLTFEEYCTLLCLIESALNSRPLCSVPDDASCNNVLTPNHLLTGRASNTYFEPSLTTVPINHLTRWEHLQKMYQHYWSSWSRDYLLELQRRNKWYKTTPNLEVGQLVLVREDGTPPLAWPLAKVTELFPGADGTVRVVNVKMCGKFYKRPVVKLVPLPIN